MLLPKFIIQENIIPVILITLMIPMTNINQYPFPWIMNSLTSVKPPPEPPHFIPPPPCDERKKS